MKYYTLLLLTLLISSSCIKSKMKSADFIIQNSTNSQIMIYSCAYSNSGYGNITNNCLTDHISTGATQSMRAKTLPKKDAEMLSINDMFNVFEISKNGIKNTKSVFNDSLWRKTIYDSKVEYIMIIDSTFF